MIQRLYIDINANGQTITPSVIIDDVVTALAATSGASRAMIEIPIHLNGRAVGVRLAGTLTAQVEIFSVVADVYNGG